MRLSIKHILIENFRCFEKLDTDLWDKTIILGSNESGKSSIGTAIMWCLFGKSVENESTFEIVPYGKYGVVSPSVTLECMLDERKVTVQRVYEAKKYRDGTFSKYETKAFINGILQSISDFDLWVSQNICDNQIFRITCNPKTFAENCPHKAKELVWQAQRRLLLSIIGYSESDIETAKDSNRWLDLVEPISQYGSCNNYLLYLKKRYSETQKALEAVNIKLEQQHENIQDCEFSSVSEIESEMDSVKSEMSILENKNIAYKGKKRSGDFLEKKSEIENLQKYQSDLIQKYKDDMKFVEEQKQKLNEEWIQQKQALQILVDKLTKYISKVEELQREKVDEICPTCGAKLNDQKIEDAKQKTAERIKNGNAHIQKLKAEQEQLIKSIKCIEEKSQTILIPTYPVQIDQLSDKITQLLEETATYRISEMEEMPGYIESKGILSQKLSDLQSKLNILKLNEKMIEVLRRLEADKENIIVELSNIQKSLDLAKQFIFEKCTMAETEINKLFENVRFRLFEQNKTNNEVKEVCILTYNGISYKDLSASTKIISGLEIAKAFQKYYNFIGPIILDNMESVNGNVAVNGQLLSLYVKSDGCPNCHSLHHTRRLSNGKWKCLDCGQEWVKQVEIKEDMLQNEWRTKC